MVQSNVLVDMLLEKCVYFEPDPQNNCIAFARTKPAQMTEKAASNSNRAHADNESTQTAVSL